MKSLFDYDVLVNDVFYRGYHILLWTEQNPQMSKLDKETISNTIMDTLVYKGLINPEKESLDLDTLSIRDNLNYYRYQKQPDVIGIPLCFMEQYENIICEFSGRITAAIFLSKPAGKTSFCVYDMNNVASLIFDSFDLVNASYNSPTRIGLRVSSRPFIEITYNDEKYLMDWLTKRMYKTSSFIDKYSMIEIERKNNAKFTRKQKIAYKDGAKQITDQLQIGLAFYSISVIFQSYNFQKGEMDQIKYYYEKYINAHPELIEKVEEIMPKNSDDTSLLQKLLESKKN